MNIIVSKKKKKIQQYSFLTWSPDVGLSLTCHGRGLGQGYALSVAQKNVFDDITEMDHQNKAK